MTDYDSSLDLVARLVKQFRTNLAAYHAPDYKEALARQDLIDPLFIALGWDVRNENHVAPQYREVIPEQSLDVEGHTKSPDYAFRVGQRPNSLPRPKSRASRSKPPPVRPTNCAATPGAPSRRFRSSPILKSCRCTIVVPARPKRTRRAPGASTCTPLKNTPTAGAKSGMCSRVRPSGAARSTSMCRSAKDDRRAK
jgi:hypothetical protein